ncbi:MAG: hypothetical protein RR582_06815, partial [Niameybacter sp.]
IEEVGFTRIDFALDGPTIILHESIEDYNHIRITMMHNENFETHFTGTRSKGVDTMLLRASTYFAWGSPAIIEHTLCAKLEAGSIINVELVKEKVIDPKTGESTGREVAINDTFQDIIEISVSE